jgi:D-sedoheptulose 7-phosphate isomerase
LAPQDFFRWYREQELAAWQRLDLAEVARLAAEVERCERQGRNVWVMGNGGSVSTAQHFAADLSKTTWVKDRPRIKSLCLSENCALLTAIGNDQSFEDIFAFQVEALVGRQDLVILISGSGNSPNLVAAASAARKAGAVVAGLLGFDGGHLAALVDVRVLVAADQYGVIEDMHLAIAHAVSFWLKQRRTP